MKGYSQKEDLDVVIHQKTLNKLFDALGEISGSSEYKVWFKTGTYTWKLRDVDVKLMKDSAVFKTVVKVETGISDYVDTVNGKLAISYDERKNKVLVRVVDAPFEIYLRFLGTKIKIANIQLAEYFKEPITFDGPSGIAGDFLLDMPDGTQRKLRSKVTSGKVFIEPGKIRVLSTVDFLRLDSLIK